MRIFLSHTYTYIYIYIYIYARIGVGAITPNCVMVEFMDAWHTTVTTTATAGATYVGGGFGNGMYI